jgi:hypothetical protein
MTPSSIPVEIARNFSCQTLGIVLNIESDQHPAHQTAQYSAFWLEKCREVFQEALSAGHRHVVLVCIEFIGHFAKVIQVKSSSATLSLCLSLTLSLSLSLSLFVFLTDFLR